MPPPGSPRRSTVYKPELALKANTHRHHRARLGGALLTNQKPHATSAAPAALAGLHRCGTVSARLSSPQARPCHIVDRRSPNDFARGPKTPLDTEREV